MSYCEQCAALQRQNDLLANDRDGYVQLLTDENNKLRAEVEKRRALTVKADEAIARQQQDLEEATDRAADCDILRAQVDTAAEMLREVKVRNNTLTARVEELEGALSWIDQQRYTDRDTINPDNAFGKVGKLNGKIIAIMNRARAALEEKR